MVVSNLEAGPEAIGAACLCNLQSLVIHTYVTIRWLSG